MNKNLLLICLSLIVTTCFSQEISGNLERKGKLFFKVGTEYRITPIESKQTFRDPTLGLVNPDIQNSGPSLYYGLEFFPWQKISFVFNHSIRYGLLNTPSPNEIPGDFGTANGTYRLFNGFHFATNIHFKINTKWEVFGQVGVSLLNRNSAYSKKKSFFDEEGNFLASITVTQDYNLNTYNLGVGVKRDRLEIALGIYYTSKPPYFEESVGYFIPKINLGYTLGKL